MHVSQPVIRRTSVALLFTLLAASAVAQAADLPSPWPTSGWQASAPEAQGMASSALADLVDFGAARGMDSLLVERHGQVVLDAYYAPFKPGMRHVVNSATKAIVGTLVGVALQEGKIGRLDAPMLSFFPERKVANVDARKKAITLQNLLDATSGLNWHEPDGDGTPGETTVMGPDDDWVGFVLDRPMAQAPGVSFNYNSGTWHLLSAIIAKQTGSDTLDYAKQKLFAPLGITDVAWRRSPQGLPMGGGGLFMQPCDMAKIGYLYLHGGEWAGRRLLPPGWTDRVFHPQVDMHMEIFRYANGWWAIPKKHAFMAVGLLRQLIIVLPEIDAVAVVTGREDYPFTELIDRIARAAKSPTALAADAAGSARLADRIADAGIEKRSPVAPVPGLASVVSGKTYRFAASTTDIRSMKLDLTSTDPHYEITRGTSAAPDAPAYRIEGPIGLDGLFRLRDEARQGFAPSVAVKGNWLNDSSFQLIVRSLPEGSVTTFVLRFSGSHVDVSLEDNYGVHARFEGEASE